MNDAMWSAIERLVGRPGARRETPARSRSLYANQKASWRDVFCDLQKSLAARVKKSGQKWSEVVNRRGAPSERPLQWHEDNGLFFRCAADGASHAWMASVGALDRNFESGGQKWSGSGHEGWPLASPEKGEKNHVANYGMNPVVPGKRPGGPP